MTLSEYDQIKDVLKGIKRLNDPNKRYQFKNKQYSFVDNKVCQTKEILKDRNLKQYSIETKRLVYLEEFSDILYDAHCIKRMRQGITKTFEYIQSHYTGIPKVAVRAFRKFCYICDLNVKQKSQPRLTPISSSHIFERVQIDLIDMRCQPDGEYNWIGHMEDHNGQFHALWAQKKKEGY